MTTGLIPFNRVFLTGREISYVSEALTAGHLAGDGPFTHKCQHWLEQKHQTPKALLTHSCTAALEMAAILADIQPGDEVIMPSFTFVSTANAFVLRGGIPVFVDIRPDTLNIDETLIEAAITPRTKAIAVVHYGGVACEMDAIMDISERHNLLVIEDAAQAVLAGYKGRMLGSIGHLGALSFHATKNVISGEGGALLINRDEYIQRAEIIREKGTDRSRFFRGEVDKYSWVDTGSSFLPSDLMAAVLWAQLEAAPEIIALRMAVWDSYRALLKDMAGANLLTIPAECRQNAHLFALILDRAELRDGFLAGLKKAGIHATFHYVPLHDSIGGRRFGRCSGTLPQTESISERLVRLPLWAGLSPADGSHVAETVKAVIHAVEEIQLSSCGLRQ